MGWQHVARGRAQRTPPVSRNKYSHPERMPENRMLVSLQDAFESLEPPQWRLVYHRLQAALFSAEGSNIKS